MKKRILSLVLALVLALSLLPTTVFAASYTFNEKATIFTQNFTTETPRPNDLGDYFTVESTPLSPSNGTTTWNTGTNGTSVNVFNMNGSKKYGETHAVLTFTFKKSCNFWMKLLFAMKDSGSYADIQLNGVSKIKATEDNKLTSPYSLDVKKGDVLKIDFYSDDNFNTPCQMTIKNIRCTALATKDAKITFDSNATASGYKITGTMDAQTVPIGEATALTANGFTNTYTKYQAGKDYGGEVKFLGWNTKSDGTGTAYADGAEITATGDTTLYAQWAKNYVQVTYDLNNPDAPDAVNPTVRTDVGFKYSIPSTEPTREGYSFRGWYTAPLGGDTITEDLSGKYTVKDDARLTQADANEGEITFYARWGKYIKATIDGGEYTGSLSGGNWISTGIDNQLKDRMDAMLGKWTGKYRPEGKVFEGWYIKNADGSYGDKVYPLDTPYDYTNKLGNSVTFIAKWIAPAYVIRYEAGNTGATGTMADQTVGFGTDAALSECAFTVKGYHFAGWKGSDGNTYKDGAAISRAWDDAASKNGEVLTLTATWEKGINYQEALDKVFVEGKLYDPGTDKAIAYDAVTSDVHFPTTRDVGKFTYDKYGLGFDGNVTPIVIESSDSNVIAAPDTPNSARVTVYRPLPGEAAKTVTVTVKIMNRPGGAGTGYTGTLAEKQIKLTVQPMTQDEITAAEAFMQKVCTQDVYWEGIRKANSDKNAITGDLWSFIEIVPNGDGYKFIRTEENAKGVGVKADQIDGWYDSQMYRAFRSSQPDIVAHENLLVTKPQYNTEVTIDSVLSYTEYAKYWEKFKDNEAYAQFAKFYKQPIFLTVKVAGSTGVDDPNAGTAVTADVKIIGYGDDFLSTAKDYTYTGKVNANVTAWDAVKACLLANGYTYEGSGSYVSAITDKNGVKLGEKEHGDMSGWMYRVIRGGKTIIPGAVMANYSLQKGDKVELYYSTASVPEEPTITPEDVIDLIDAIGEVDLSKGTAISKARLAYNDLSGAEKDQVTNYDVLTAAEAAYAKLVAEMGKKLEDIYKTTGDYMSKLGIPGVGGEWVALGLARSGRTVPAGYYDAVVKYVQEHADANERLARSKVTDNARIILALTAIGKDVTNVGGHNLLKGLDNMDYVQTQGINGPIFTLIALDSHNYPTMGDVTREKLIQAILDAQLSDGGWAFSGDEADVDMTAMAIQALAPYYKTNETVKTAVDKALDVLSRLQQADGGFASGDSANCESCAQVVVALTALGIDPLTDSRFIKNGVTMLDALASFYVTGGGFRHTANGDLDGMATEQGYYALASYYRFLNGQTRLYDMSDVAVQTGGTSGGDNSGNGTNNGGTPATGDTGVLVWVIALPVAAVAAAFVFKRKKREE